MKNTQMKKMTRNYQLLTKVESGKCRRVTAATDLTCHVMTQRAWENESAMSFRRSAARNSIRSHSKRCGSCYHLIVKKTNYIIFHPYQKRLNYDVNIKILDSRVNKYFNLERKEYIKYLGVMIDNHLSWKHHINYVALKISRNIGILAKLRHFVPPKTLFGIYNSLIFLTFLMASLPGARLQKLT